MATRWAAMAETKALRKAMAYERNWYQRNKEVSSASGPAWTERAEQAAYALDQMLCEIARLSTPMRRRK